MRLPARLSGTVLAAALFASCGPIFEDSAARGLLTVVSERVSPTPQEPPQVPITRAQADANPGAFLLVYAYGGTSIAALVKAGANQGRDTWLSADNVSVTEENGIMIATRGFVRDLMAADVRGVRRAIEAGSGTVMRRHETLDDLDQISTELLQCSIVSKGPETVEILGRPIATRRIEEQCVGENYVFTNIYWLDGSNRMVRSRQVVSPDAGFLTIEHP